MSSTRQVCYLALHIIIIGILSFVLGGIWFNLASNYGWPATPGYLPRYFHADGEGGYDIWAIEMQLASFLILLSIYIFLRLHCRDRDPWRSSRDRRR